MNTVKPQLLVQNNVSGTGGTLFFRRTKAIYLNESSEASTRRLPLIAVIAGALAAAVLLFTASPAHAISGGKVTSLPWVVQTISLTNSGVDTCSGAALNELMVILAKHCKANSVLYPDGGVAYVSSAYPVEGADVQVLVLAGEHPLQAYPTLGPDYLALGTPFPPGTVGTMYGYGSGPTEWPQKRLRLVLKSHGTVLDDSTVDIFRMTERDGQTEHGDSGGPLLINGLLVAVHRASGKDKADGQRVVELHGISKALPLIRQLEHGRELRSVKEQRFYPGAWIRAVNVANGKLSITMSSQLVNSGKTVAIWINGKYAGHLFNDVSYYCSKTNVTGASILSPTTKVRDGDLVQIGIVTDVDNPEGSELLYEKRLTGIEAVWLADGHAVIRLSNELLNSGQRVIVWLNGAYASEVYKGTVYHAGRANQEGGVFIYSGDATPATTLQIGVVPGLPGQGYGAPADAKLLYSGPVVETLR